VGKVSGSRAYISSTSPAAIHKENRAGYWNVEKDCASLVVPRIENMAPIVGPNKNPRQNAIAMAA